LAQPEGRARKVAARLSSSSTVWRLRRRLRASFFCVGLRGGGRTALVGWWPCRSSWGSSPSVVRRRMAVRRRLAMRGGQNRLVGSARRADLATLWPNLVTAGVCARSGWWHMGWQRQHGGWDGSLGAPPVWPGWSPFLCLPPPVVATGRLNGHARWQLDGEGGVAGGACVGSLDGW
jgi:hypothetical protein